jgi:serine/threonine protein kinase
VDEHPPIPGYELVELLGRNGHLVYKARQLTSGQFVWLNVVPSGGEFGRIVAEQFRHKARVLAILDHPNIVRLVEMGEAEDFGFFSALQYVEGASLAEIGRRMKLPDYREVVRIAGLVANALDYAHGRNIVHGNVHPKHILLDCTRHVFLIDFGEVDPTLPEGAIFGNPHFLAPEQLEGESGKAVPQTDVYGLAEVVFRLLTGVYPFQKAVGIEQLMKLKRSVQAPSVGDFRPEMPRRVDLTLQKAMALRPEDRHGSAGQFVEELDQALQAGPERPKKWWQFWRFASVQ